MAGDPLDDVLNLEDQFYQDGYQQGAEDGKQAGKSEGRSFGLEKAFEKFLESGRLYGKAVVWANRLPTQQHLQGTRPSESGTSGNQVASNGDTPTNSSQIQELPRLPNNSRLDKNIATLHALVEPESLSTENTDKAVNDFDERIKAAQGKCKIIEKLAGETNARSESGGASKSSGGENAKSARKPVATSAEGW